MICKAAKNITTLHDLNERGENLRRSPRKLKKKSHRNRNILVTVSALIALAVVSLSVFLLTAGSAAAGTKVILPTSYPAGSETGNALVVYDPGTTGTIKTVAGQMANDLAAQGYFVYLAGIDSSTAKGNASQYQVVVVGGPLNNGKASDAVQSYLKNLYQANGTRIGVFGVGNSDSSNNQIAPLPGGSNLTIKETLEINASENTSAQSTEFVTQLLS